MLARNVAKRPPRAMNGLAIESVLRPPFISYPIQFVKTQKKLSFTWQQALAPAPEARKISIGSRPSAEAIGAHSVAAVVTATVPDPCTTFRIAEMTNGIRMNGRPVLMTMAQGPHLHRKR